jgi:hypothetical protein
MRCPPKEIKEKSTSIRHIEGGWWVCKLLALSEWLIRFHIPHSKGNTRERVKLPCVKLE